MSSFQALQKQLAPCRRFLGRHPLYRHLERTDQVRIFMQHHVFAVWDFMCLVKTLQRQLSCTESIWTPSPYPEAARFVNEIVLDEESDTMADGSYKSHFEWYLDAMAEIGANRKEILVFLDRLQKFQNQPRAALDSICCDQTQAFVRNTIEVTKKPVAAVVGAFIFGREMLISQMFEQILQVVPDECSIFQEYLARHADVDEAHQGPMAEKLLEEVCGRDPAKWQMAAEAAKEAVWHRNQLWTVVLQKIKEEEEKRQKRPTLTLVQAAANSY